MDPPTYSFPSPPPPPGLPPPNGSVSFWQEGVRASKIVNTRTTERLPGEADVVIVGSGISGALIAWNLLHSSEPPQRVVMLEARDACSGATGKWVRMTCSWLWLTEVETPDTVDLISQWRGYQTYRDQLGSKMAMKILANERETHEGLTKFIKQEGIDCDVWNGLTYDVAVTEENKRILAERYRLWKEAGGEVSRVQQELSSERAFEKSRIKGALACWSWPAATLHPVKFVYNVLSRCLDKGLNLQTFTPATSCRRVPGDRPLYEIVTGRGSMKTPIVIHASNGFAPTLLPFLKPHVNTTPFVCTKLVPPQSLSGSNALQNSYALWSKDTFLTVNPRSTSDGVILFGGDNEGYGHLVKLLRQHPESLNDDRLANYQPSIDAANKFTKDHLADWPEDSAPGVGVTNNWSGLIGETSDGLPFIGRVPGMPGHYISAGHNGHGMARIFTASAAIAKMVQDPLATLTTCGIPECFDMSEERLGRLQSRL